MHLSPGSLVRALSVLAVVAISASAQSLHYEHTGFDSSLGYGFMVNRLGDVDQDGVNDYYIGTRLQNSAEIRSGATGMMIRDHNDTYVGCFGMAAIGMGDLNDDGYDEYAIGAPRDFGLSAQSGNVRVFSGIDGSLLYFLPSINATGRFGLRLANLGDIDDDGYDDLLVSAHWDSTNAFHSGAAFVFSGVDGQALFSVFGDAEDDVFGWSVSGVGDVNDDDVPDFLVGAPREFTDPTSSPAGYVRVYSGADGSLITQHDGSHADDQFGVDVAGIDDLDGDGVAEIIIGVAGHLTDGDPKGRVLVLSGASGAVIMDKRGKLNSQFGANVKSVSDFNGDGVPDILASACYCVGKLAILYPGEGYLQILSGATGTRLAFVKGADGTRFGYRADGVGDLNGDGIEDFVVGSNLSDELGTETGSVRVFSGSDLALATDRFELSATAGGVQTFSIEAGAARAGEQFFLFGSWTGTSPGIPVAPGVHLPLNWDVYTEITLQLGNVPGFMFWGTLDGAGSGQSMLSVPAGLAAAPTLVGLTLHHAYMLSEGNGFTFASNAVPLTFGP